MGHGHSECHKTGSTQVLSGPVPFGCFAAEYPLGDSTPIVLGLSLAHVRWGEAPNMMFGYHQGMSMFGLNSGAVDSWFWMR
jgi:hypothetical protein